MAVKYKLVMFDFDGTLADSLPWMISVIHKIGEKFKIKLPEGEQLEALRSADGRDMMKRLGVPFWKAPQMVHYARQLASRDVNQIPLFDGVSDMLTSLCRQGITLAMVSSNAGENIKRVLNPELTSLFSYFECGASLSGKDAHIKRVLKQSRITANQAILIGDEVRDVEAAHKTGVASGAVAWGYNTPAVLAAHAPTEFFISIDDLTSKLLNQV